MNDLEILLPKYFSGEATPEERQAVEAWAQASAEHHSEFVLFQTLWKETAPAKVKTYDAQTAWAKVAPHISERPKAKIVEMKHARRWPILAAAAAVAVLIIAGQFFFGSGMEVQWQEVAAGQEVRQVNLSDGSVVWLNRGAKVRFPQNFEGGDRKVKLEGEAFFEVASDSTKPFIIHSEAAEVTVLGTSFNFAVKPDGAELTVATGRVRFEGTFGEFVILAKGEKGLCDNHQRTLRKTINSDPNYLSWKTGIFDFEGLSLPQVVASLNTFYRKKPIVISSLTPTTCALSAHFESLKIEAVLDVVTATCGLKWVEKELNFEVIQE